MRKFLSLVLALVMMMSLITINTSAVEFTDGDDISSDAFREAVDVISTIHVVDGYENGSFNPSGNLTRGAAAKIICNLILGPTTASQLHADTAPFRDVPVNHDFAGYIAYCQKEGIIGGYGDGTYRPAGTLTGNAFMKMLLGALGYDAEIEQYGGPNWSINVAKRAIGIGLDDGLEEAFNGAKFITREEAALYSLNTLKADMVEYENKITASVNGADVTIGNSNATSRTWQSQQTKRNNIYNDNIVQFAEQYFNKLVLTRDVDAFGRPSRDWDFDGDSIGQYVIYSLMKQDYTVEVTGKDLYDLLGDNAVKNYDFTITIDGVDVDSADGGPVLKDKDKAASYFDEDFMTRTYKSGVGQTGKGVLTQVFVEPGVGNTGNVWVSVINTYLAKATGDYSEKKDEIKFDVFALEKDTAKDVYYKYHDDTYGFACKAPAEQKRTLTVTGEDFPEVTEMEKDDIVLVNVANGNIEIISEPEVISAATLTEFSRNNYVVKDGDKYEYDTTIEYDVETLDNYTGVAGAQQLKDTEYDMYLDPYGYLIGIKVVEATKNYIFLTGIDQGTSNLKNKTADAAGILLDGTFVEFQMSMKDSKAWNPNHKFVDDGTSNLDKATSAKEVSFIGHPLWNTWCTYTVDKDGVYTLKEVRGAIDTANGVKAAQKHDNNYADKTIDHKHVSLVGNGAGYSYVYGNDDTVYIVPELEAVATDTEIVQNTVNVPDNAVAPTSGNLIVKSPVGIISGVDSVATGVNNVDLRTWKLSEIQAQDDNKLANVSGVLPGNVYTLFDKDGYVIAAIVVGEDNGSTKNLVYSHKDDVESEKYSSADDEWTWTRKVIFNGEEILLTQTGSKLSESIDKDHMTQNTWYEVTYKADGTVKSVKPAYYTEKKQEVGDTKASSPALVLADKDTETPGDFVSDILDLEYALNDSKNDGTTLYEEVWGAYSGSVKAGGKQVRMGVAPSLKGSTLYVDTLNQRGFYVQQDVKTVLIQKNDGKSDTTYYDSISDLENVLEDLNLDDKGTTSTSDDTYLFKISAILTNGRASVVIIHDWNETGATKGNNKNDNDDDTLPSYSDLSVITSGMNLSSSLGRYVDGKLYIQFNGLNADATDLTIKNIQVVETPSNKTHYLDDIKFTKDKGVQHYVWSTDLDIRDETNVLTVTGDTTTANKLAVDYSNVKYGTDPADYSGPAEIPTAAGTTFDVRINKPTGAAEWKVTASAGTNVAAPGGYSAVDANDSAVTLGTTDITTDYITVTVTPTSVAAASGPNLTVSVTEWNYTLDTANADLGTGVLLVKSNSSNPTSLTHDTAENAIKVDVIAGTNLEDTDRVAVNYTVGRTTKTVYSTAGDGSSNSATITLDPVTATSETSIVINSVGIQKSFKAASISGTIAATTNMTGTGSWAVYKEAGCTTAVTASNWFDIGDTVYVKVTVGTLDTDKTTNIKLNGATVAEDVDTAGAITTPFTYDVPSSGVPTIAVTAAD